MSNTKKGWNASNFASNNSFSKFAFDSFLGDGERRLLLLRNVETVRGEGVTVREKEDETNCSRDVGVQWGAQERRMRLFADVSTSNMSVPVRRRRA